MSNRRDHIIQTQGPSAWAAWKAGNADQNQIAMAVRYTLSQLSKICPGQAVEIRVPPVGAVQIRKGTTHRRGQPPAVVETNPHTWLSLVSGQKDWQTSVSNGAIQAFGEGSNLSDLLPLLENV